MAACFGQSVEQCPFNDCGDDCAFDPENLERGSE